MPPRILPAEPVSLVLYDDPVSPWCLVAERRVRAALDELHGTFAPLRLEPFPLRADPGALSPSERRALVRAARRAAREPEAAGTNAELWLARNPPHSTLPALAAVLAARLQGARQEAALREAVRDAALVRGLDPTRRDVLLELAVAAGLDVARFDAALSSPATGRRVLECFEEALDKGIVAAPALVIGDEWLIAGPRGAQEYLRVLRRYAATRLGLQTLRVVH